jgi:hypothetical protein
MRWNVEAADKGTGIERVIQIEAHSAQDAEQIARRHGLLVSSVHPLPVQSDAKKPDIAAPAPVSRPGNGSSEVLQPEADRPAPRAKPEYKEIATGAHWVGICGGAASILGIITLLAGAICLITGVAIMNDPSNHANNGVTFVASGVGLLCWGIAALLGGVVLNMLSALSLAVRVIARNSFK